MGLKITYKHDHECSRKDQEVVVRPDSEDGVSFMSILWCEELLVELNRAKIERL